MELHFGIQNILFLVALGLAAYFFAKNFGKVWRNINLGKAVLRNDRPNERWALMTRVALGQSKMVKRKVVAGFFHVIVYAGFLLINIEVAEILLDGILGSHRMFRPFLGPVYDAAIHFFEILAVMVIIACLIFLWRRNVQKVDRFKELKGWAKRDGNNILYIELVLMTALLLLGAAEANIEGNGVDGWIVSSQLAPIFSGMDQGTLHAIERFAWWFHILGILAFLNYLPYSKHFHIIMAFPNVWHSKLEPAGQFTNMESVKKEVELMMDPNADPFAAPAEGDAAEEPSRFGAKDVLDLHRVQLMNAYSCTECGRCTSSCPANQTGKKLSPRKIMMDTRDRLEEVSAIVDAKGKFEEDGKSLLDDYISREEIWACTTCNACAEACPVNIDPMSIIVEMRRYLVMEESAANPALNTMMTNIENNAAPWAYAQADRANWINE
ncbi:4Fe-4S dicluster domain-containing protein [Croceimicrobium hydrocarbonivorans]|uniref:4Fe-4S dicluster domain-containing protein n=1 Tax=Croceimicrobium hydrocarbonivorans TaxID=2761580 RepID=A0A7H0VDR9_9FLAO|nr:4Fe-4S dicluster domain-containing protein [Croceimicrobium hydrocarbonivorans]QNR23867.1 4Fe-4S dicluster domain-containing protein [Croceimicrobium hydrocarbonivorans]